MELISFEEYKKRYNFPLVVTIGSFDGIHIGHQELIKTTVLKAVENNYKSAVITFDPHPLNVIGNKNHTNITSIIDKAHIINNFKVDYLIVINFNEAFSKITKEEFINNYLLSINVCEVVVGEDFKFGCNGEGKASEISSLSNNKINTKIIDLIEFDNEKIGSSKIIELLKNGEIETVNSLLGYNYSFNGIVIRGNQIGRKMGFPTANIDNDSVKKLLKVGVYGVLVYLNKEAYLGMMNLGHNPTCNYQDNLSIEINLFDLDIDLYNKILKIECFCYVRDEFKFQTMDELIERLKLDKEIIINKNLMLAKKSKK